MEEMERLRSLRQNREPELVPQGACAEADVELAPSFPGPASITSGTSRQCGNVHICRPATGVHVSGLSCLSSGPLDRVDDTHQPSYEALGQTKHDAEDVLMAGNNSEDVASHDAPQPPWEYQFSQPDPASAEASSEGGSRPGNRRHSETSFVRKRSCAGRAHFQDETPTSFSRRSSIAKNSDASPDGIKPRSPVRSRRYSEPASRPVEQSPRLAALVPAFRNLWKLVSPPPGTSSLSSRSPQQLTLPEPDMMPPPSLSGRARLGSVVDASTSTFGLLLVMTFLPHLHVLYLRPPPQLYCSLYTQQRALTRTLFAGAARSCLPSHAGPNSYRKKHE
jgi:hypothetical protein